MKITKRAVPVTLAVAVLILLGPAVARADLLVASAGSNQVLRYDGNTGGFQAVFVTAGSGGLSGPVGLVFGPDGNLYVASAGSNQVLRYNGTTGAFINAFVTTGSGGLSLPVGLLFTTTAVPTLSEWIQILMVGFLIATGVWMMRRRWPALA